MSEIKKILEDNSFRFKHQLGQNFITDTNLLNAVVNDSGADNNTTVIEIGAGAGTLTRALSERAKEVISFEIDSDLVPVLEKYLSARNNVKIINRDIIKVTDNEIEEMTGGKDFIVVANLPYYITTPVIMRFIEGNLRAKSITVMVQKEVADRLVAKPDTEEYGAITVAVGIVADVKITRTVSRKLFYPVPNVDSAIVRIDINRAKYEVKDLALLKKLIRSAFAMRRKTLINNISKDFDITKEQGKILLEKVNLDSKVRGETLSEVQFTELAEALGGILC